MGVYFKKKHQFFFSKYEKISKKWPDKLAVKFNSRVGKKFVTK